MKDLKNHIAILLDLSGSMCRVTSALKVFNNQIKYLQEQSLIFGQETRVSVYTFNSEVDCMISDVDVARPMEVRRLIASGSTRMFDAIKLSIEDLQALPQKYGDHDFMIYILTDGEENTSQCKLPEIQRILNSLPNNFCVAAFVPDMNSRSLMIKYGLSKGNVEVWNPDKAGVEEVGVKFGKTVSNYFQARSKGDTTRRHTIFSDLSEVTASNVNQVLSEVSGVVVINQDVKAIEIKDLVENGGRHYKKGEWYYELVKNEHIQPTKQIAIQNKKNGKVYSGANARQLLNLPNQEVKVTPQHSPEWNIYVQSTSVNRKVIPKQRIMRIV